MKNLKEMSYEELKQQRDLIVNAKAFSICDIDRRGFQQVIEGLEDEIYRREIGKSRVLAAITGVLVLFCICTSSCRSTLTAVGQVAKGAGDGASTFLNGVGDFCIEEGKPDK